MRLNVSSKLKFSHTDPPSESPIATAIEHQLLKHNLTDTIFRREYPAPTEWANFRIDIVLSVGERRIGIECDGADFHDEFRDELRDSLILGSGLVDTIWRLPGADIHNHVHDCLCLIALYDRFIFDERTRAVFMKQCSELVRAHIPEPHERILMAVDSERMPARSGYIDLRRRTRTKTYSPIGQHWRYLFEYAQGHRDISFSELYAMRLEELQQANKP